MVRLLAVWVFEAVVVVFMGSHDGAGGGREFGLEAKKKALKGPIGDATGTA
jgi:hypothetical protein